MFLFAHAFYILFYLQNWLVTGFSIVLCCCIYIYIYIFYFTLQLSFLMVDLFVKATQFFRLLSSFLWWWNTYLYHLCHNFIHKFWNYCIDTFDVIYRRREFITDIGFHMAIAFIWSWSECPAQWYVGQFIGFIQNPMKHLSKSFGRNSWRRC